jgi:hypothetical protein
MGIGMALHEDLIYDRRSGSPLSAGYYGARVATHRDAPEIEVIFIESDDGLGPFGAKSMGESSKVPSPAAVATAVCNAIVARIRICRSRENRRRWQDGGAGMKAFTNRERHVSQAMTSSAGAPNRGRACRRRNDLLRMMKTALAGRARQPQSIRVWIG